MAPKYHIVLISREILGTIVYIISNDLLGEILITGIVAESLYKCHPALFQLPDLDICGADGDIFPVSIKGAGLFHMVKLCPAGHDKEVYIIRDIGRHGICQVLCQTRIISFQHGPGSKHHNGPCLFIRRLFGIKPNVRSDSLILYRNLAGKLL